LNAGQLAVTHGLEEDADEPYEDADVRQQRGF